MIWEMLGFSHQFPMAWENATKPIVRGEPGIGNHTFPIEGVRRFSAIAFYRPLSLILALDLIYQQNNNNKLCSK